MAKNDRPLVVLCSAGGAGSCCVTRKSRCKTLIGPLSTRVIGSPFVTWISVRRGD
jgi:hypothetical protein